jgi:hypothetical protein
VGVHDVDKYPEIKRLLGIPEDEPIFILRAQDNASLPTINAYWDVVTDMGVALDFAADLDDCRIEFENFRLAHPDSMKTPD